MSDAIQAAPSARDSMFDKTTDAQVSETAECAVPGCERADGPHPPLLGDRKQRDARSVSGRVGRGDVSHTWPRGPSSDWCSGGSGAACDMGGTRPRRRREREEREERGSTEAGTRRRCGAPSAGLARQQDAGGQARGRRIRSESEALFGHAAGLCRVQARDGGRTHGADRRGHPRLRQVCPPHDI
jgi:hypothetical protein